MNAIDSSHIEEQQPHLADPTVPWRERDLHNIDLRSLDLRNLDLRGADFRDADLRGIDFTGAQLTCACFAHARGGLPRRWIITTVTTALLATFVTGLMVGYASGVWEWFDTRAESYLPKMYQQILSLTAFCTLLFSVWILVRRGLGIALGVFALVGTTVCVLTAAWGNANVAGALIILLVVGVASLLAAIVLFTTVILCLQGIVAIQWPRWLLESTTAPRFPLRVARPRHFLVLIALAGALAGAAVGLWEAVIGRAVADPQPLTITFILTMALPILIILAALVVSLFLARKALTEDERFVLMRRLVVGLLTSGGTHFRGADLTGADFSYAVLDHSDLRQAKLDGTRWIAAAGVERARTEGSYLAVPAIRTLVTSNSGRAECFDRLDLSRLNLTGADLRDATFFGADLTGTNLVGADLTGAKLVHSQCYGTDLRGVTLTGAVIEEWAISTDTILTDVHCDYIYLRLPTAQDRDPWRKPDNRQEIFNPGDFELFMAPFVKTLDLYRQQYVDLRSVGQLMKPLDLFHHDAIDPSASAAALRQLAEEHPDANLQVVAIEGLRSDKVHLRVNVAAEGDSAALSQQYAALYRQFSSSTTRNLESLVDALLAKDERIRRLESMVVAATNNAAFYIQTQIPLGIVLKSLILTANPLDTPRLQLDVELREIQAELALARYRNVIDIIPLFAARPIDLQRALNEHQPQIIQFSGHGTVNGEIMLLDDAGNAAPIAASTLLALFTPLADQLRLVILNSCYAMVPSTAITSVIECVIGMNDAISDAGATKFIAAIYRALGYGHSVQAAFEQGIVALQLAQSAEEAIPQLYCRADINPSKVVLIPGPAAVAAPNGGSDLQF